MADAWFRWLQDVPQTVGGADEGIPVEIRTLQFKRQSDIPEILAYHDPIDDSQYSQELYLRLELLGMTADTEVSDIYFWLLSPSTKFLVDSGITIKYRLTNTFAAPLNSAMVGGVAVPTIRASAIQWTTPHGNKLSITGQTTDYLVLQVGYPVSTPFPPPIRLGVYRTVS